MHKTDHDGRAILPEALVEQAKVAVRSSVDQIRNLQHVEGCWDAPCEFDPSETAIYLLFTHYMGRSDAALDAQMIRYLRSLHQSSGGWSAYPGGPPMLDSTSLCYAAMRAGGVPASDPMLVKARSAIHELGGLGATTGNARIILALTGQIPRIVLPYLSARIACTPRRIAWLRQRFGVCILGVLPMLILTTRNAIRPLPKEHSIAELQGDTRWQLRPSPKQFADGNDYRKQRSIFSYARIDLSWQVLSIASVMSQWIERLLPNKRAEQGVIQAILKFQEAEGSFGELSFATCLNLMALASVDEEAYRESVDRGCDWLRNQLVPDGSGMRRQTNPSISHSTAYALRALLDAANEPDSDCVARAVDWLTAHVTSRGGDWSNTLPATIQTSGWAFGKTCVEADSTAIVLGKVCRGTSINIEVLERVVRWLLAMQHPSGGWAAYVASSIPMRWFTTDVYSTIINDAIHANNDVTARVLFALQSTSAACPLLMHDIARAVEQGLKFLWRQQKSDGSWFGRWFTNYAYGTGQVLQALIECGVDAADPRLIKASRWLRSVQNADGGWGESQVSYETDHFEAADSNPMATSFVLQGLLALAEPDDAAIVRGIRYLLASRQSTGCWQDHGWNGVLLPGVSYIRYRLVPTCLCVSTLALWLRRYEDKVRRP